MQWVTTSQTVIVLPKVLKVLILFKNLPNSKYFTKFSVGCTFSFHCAPKHPPVLLQAQKQHWRWTVSRLLYFHPPIKIIFWIYAKLNDFLNLTQICPSPGNWTIPSSWFLFSFWLRGLTRITTLMLSPSMSDTSPPEPDLLISDLMDPFADLASDPALPGLK